MLEANAMNNGMTISQLKEFSRQFLAIPTDIPVAFTSPISPERRRGDAVKIPLEPSLSPFPKSGPGFAQNPITGVPDVEWQFEVVSQCWFDL